MTPSVKSSPSLAFRAVTIPVKLAIEPPESSSPDESVPRSNRAQSQSTTPCSMAEKPGAAPATPV
jgi:hypothetical protein